MDEDQLCYPRHKLKTYPNKEDTNNNAATRPPAMMKNLITKEVEENLVERYDTSIDQEKTYKSSWQMEEISQC